MSADFWAGYISGAVGIVIGNPLDVLKVRLQATPAPTPTPGPSLPHSSSSSSSMPSLPSTAAGKARPSWMTLAGTAAPVLGYGALNALLFVSYNRTESALNYYFLPPQPLPHISGDSSAVTTGTNLWTTWIAGAVGGLATWVVSTPTELVKCRAQLASTLSPSRSTSRSITTQHTHLPSYTQPRPHSTSTPATIRPLSASSTISGSPSSTSSSWGITKQIVRTEGIRGLYFGGLVTALRDSIGYGFYFWSYELSNRYFTPPPGTTSSEGMVGDGVRVLLCGGLAGIVTWASIFPLDVIKTRVQTQQLHTNTPEHAPLLTNHNTHTNTRQERGEGSKGAGRRLGAWAITKETYRREGIRPFFRGLGVCSVRAFIVNAVQWAVYEWIMAELGQGRITRTGAVETAL
ncbi:mitochondrial carrier domain-containing protein [Diplogelasinospora grovesii]|uniref:Mitochondrial carrier domain-containing protein n=1 Tax=Diplogelasinospora grovesii TaxID=303347 RepID=A0AAN6S1Z6_9PEZI|nr:mitochondrial carrier domain-containing protein [Diplogelasinospora grovesii]